MASGVTITGGPIETRGQGYHSTQALSQSTATVPQVALLNTEVTTFDGGAATGFDIDNVTLAAGTYGQEKSFVMLATGETKLAFTGTATGRLTFTAADDAAHMRFFNGTWYILNSSATLATAT